MPFERIIALAAVQLTLQRDRNPSGSECTANMEYMTATFSHHPIKLPHARRGVWPLHLILRRALTRLFGPPPFDPNRDPGDPGLTGPGSPSWQLIAEPAAIVGGIRGLYLQIAHPLAMAGVADHSAFRTDPLGRLHRTTAYVTVTTFGSTFEGLAAIDRVRAIHRAVRGVGPFGTPYDASSPELLTWVSIVLTSSFLATDRLFAPHPLSADQADQFVREQSTIAALLDLRISPHDIVIDHLDGDGTGSTTSLVDRLAESRRLPMIRNGWLPLSTTELRQRLETFGPDLRLSEAGEDAVAFLKTPPLTPLMGRAYRILAAGACASLEPSHAELLGLALSEAQRTAALRRARETLRVTRWASGTAPSQQLAALRAAYKLRIPAE